MDLELSFRVIFWVQLALILVFNRILPLVMAKKRKEKLMPNKEAVKNEGVFQFIIRVAGGVLFFAFIVLYAVYPPFMDALHFGLPSAARWIGVGISLIGEAMWIYAQILLSRYWSPQLRIQSDHRIMKDGPYKRIRHPIYSFMFVWSFGLVLFTSHWFFVCFFALTVILLCLRAPKEEQMMLREFGEDYARYMKETGRFFPRSGLKP
jgi:protein-S-isoprenylcysteine O-methyltransferase Ste14